MSTATFHDLMDMSEAAAALPHRPNKSTIWRWCRQGVVINGKRIFLRYQKIGRRVFIKVEDLEEFIKASTDADRGTLPDPSRREREIETAERRVKG
ncbi:MAG: helix-turn-helix domain-containing protein [Candidatus Hydrogenedentota bacterium]